MSGTRNCSKTQKIRRVDDMMVGGNSCRRRGRLKFRLMEMTRMMSVLLTSIVLVGVFGQVMGHYEDIQQEIYQIFRDINVEKDRSVKSSSGKDIIVESFSRRPTNVESLFAKDIGNFSGEDTGLGSSFQRIAEERFEHFSEQRGRRESSEILKQSRTGKSVTLSVGNKKTNPKSIDGVKPEFEKSSEGHESGEYRSIGTADLFESSGHSSGVADSRGSAGVASHRTGTEDVFGDQSLSTKFYNPGLNPDVDHLDQRQFSNIPDGRRPSHTADIDVRPLHTADIDRRTHGPWHGADYVGRRQLSTYHTLDSTADFDKRSDGSLRVADIDRRADGALRRVLSGPSNTGPLQMRVVFAGAGTWDIQLPFVATGTVDGAAVTFQVNVDWGDGSAVEVGRALSHSYTVSTAYASFVISITVNTGEALGFSCQSCDESKVDSELLSPSGGGQGTKCYRFCSNIVEISDFSLFPRWFDHTSGVNAKGTFQGCTNLDTIWFGSSVTYAQTSATAADSSITIASTVSLNSRAIDSTKWATFENLFKGCHKLRNLHMGGNSSSTGSVAKVTSLSRMFEGCTSLSETSALESYLPLFGFVKDMSYMFKDVPHIPVGGLNTALGNLVTSEVTTMAGMFQNSGLAPTTRNWVVNKVTTFEAMFDSAHNANPDVGNWVVGVGGVLKSFRNMFRNAANAELETATGEVTGEMLGKTSSGWCNTGVNNWSVTDFEGMFEGATKANPNTVCFNFYAARSTARMFKNAVKAKTPFTNSIGTGKLQFNAITDFSEMFSGARNARPNMELITFPSHGTLNVNFSRMFMDCCYALDTVHPSALVSGTNWLPDVQKFPHDLKSVGLKMEYIQNMDYMFAGCLTCDPSSFAYAMSNADISAGSYALTSMEGTFKNCCREQSAVMDLSNWQTKNVVNMKGLFEGFQGGYKISATSPYSVGGSVAGYYSVKPHEIVTLGQHPELAAELNGFQNQALSRQVVKKSGNGFTAASPADPGFSTQSVTNMDDMFRESHWIDPDLYWGFQDLRKVTSMRRMFMGARSITLAPGGEENTDFDLGYIDSGINDEIVTSYDPNSMIGEVFNTTIHNSVVLAHNRRVNGTVPTAGYPSADIDKNFIPLSHRSTGSKFYSGVRWWNLETLAATDFMFTNCRSCRPDIRYWNTPALTSMTWMFFNSGGLWPINDGNVLLEEWLRLSDESGMKIDGTAAAVAVTYTKWNPLTVGLDGTVTLATVKHAFGPCVKTHYVPHYTDAVTGMAISNMGISLADLESKKLPWTQGVNSSDEATLDDTTSKEWAEGLWGDVNVCRSCEQGNLESGAAIENLGRYALPNGRACYQHAQCPFPFSYEAYASTIDSGSVNENFIYRRLFTQNAAWVSQVGVDANVKHQLAFSPCRLGGLATFRIASLSTNMVFVFPSYYTGNPNLDGLQNLYGTGYSIAGSGRSGERPVNYIVNVNGTRSSFDGNGTPTRFATGGYPCYYFIDWTEPANEGTWVDRCVTNLTDAMNVDVTASLPTDAARIEVRRRAYRWNIASTGTKDIYVRGGIGFWDWHNWESNTRGAEDGADAFRDNFLQATNLGEFYIPHMDYMFADPTGANDIPQFTQFDLGITVTVPSLTQPAPGITGLQGVRSMRGLFLNNAKITDANILSQGTWVYSTVTDIGYLFSGASKLTLTALTDGASVVPCCNNLVTSKTQNIDGVFHNMASMGSGSDGVGTGVTFDWTGKMGGVTSMVGLFAGNKKLVLHGGKCCSSFNTEKVNNMAFMFSELHAAASPGLDLSTFKTGGVTNMRGMFQEYGNVGGDSLAYSTISDISGWDTSNVRDMTALFKNSIGANPDLSIWNTTAVSSFRFMFAQTQSFVGAYIQGSAVGSLHATYRRGLIDWNVDSAVSFLGMFMFAEKALPELRNWRPTNKLTELAWMFFGMGVQPPGTSPARTVSIGTSSDIVGNMGYDRLLFHHWSRVRYNLAASGGVRNTAHLQLMDGSFNFELVGDSKYVFGPVIGMKLSTFDMTSGLAFATEYLGTMYYHFSETYTENAPVTTYAIVPGDTDSVNGIIQNKYLSYTTDNQFSTGAQGIRVAPTNTYTAVACDGSGIESHAMIHRIECVTTCPNSDVYNAKKDPSSTSYDASIFGPRLTTVITDLSANIEHQKVLLPMPCDFGRVSGFYMKINISSTDHNSGRSTTRDLSTAVGNGGTLVNPLTGEILTAPVANSNTKASEIAIPFSGTKSSTNNCQYVLDWGEIDSEIYLWSGCVNTEQDMLKTLYHNYQEPGEYFITITGRMERMSMVGSPVTGETGTYTDMDITTTNDPTLNPYVGNLIDAIREAHNLGKLSIIDASSAFEGCASLESATGAISSTATSIKRMYRNCSELVTLGDTNTWDTINVVDASHAFESTGKLFSAAAAIFASTECCSGWNTYKVTDMQSLFSDSPYISPTTTTWKTDEVTSMQKMFRGASTANPNIKTWITSKVVNMREMFFNAHKATTPTGSGNSAFQVTEVTDMERMFMGATKANPDLEEWNVHKVTSMMAMFKQATSGLLKTPGGWNCHSARNMDSMFSGAVNARTDIYLWRAPALTSFNSMFESVGNSMRLSFSDNFSVAKITSFKRLFKGFAQGTMNFPRGLSSWQTSKVEDMSEMFYNCTSCVLAGTELADWNTARVTDMTRMFALAGNLEGENLENWNLKKVVSTQEMFQSAVKANPNVKSWLLDSVTNVDSMFEDTQGAGILLTETWNLQSVTSAKRMFRYSGGNPNVTNWNVMKIKDFSYMFEYAVNAAPDTSKWSPSSELTAADFMFRGASNAVPHVSGWVNAENLRSAAWMFFGSNAGSTGANNGQNIVSLEGSKTHPLAHRPDNIIENWTWLSKITVASDLDWLHDIYGPCDGRSKYIGDVATAGKSKLVTTAVEAAAVRGQDCEACPTRKAYFATSDASSMTNIPSDLLGHVSSPNSLVCLYGCNWNDAYWPWMDYDSGAGGSAVEVNTGSTAAYNATQVPSLNAFVTNGLITTNSDLWKRLHPRPCKEPSIAYPVTPASCNVEAHLCAASYSLKDSAGSALLTTFPLYVDGVQQGQEDCRAWCLTQRGSEGEIGFVAVYGKSVKTDGWHGHESYNCLCYRLRCYDARLAFVRTNIMMLTNPSCQQHTSAALVTIPPTTTTSTTSTTTTTTSTTILTTTTTTTTYIIPDTIGAVGYDFGFQHLVTPTQAGGIFTSCESTAGFLNTILVASMGLFCKNMQDVDAFNNPLGVGCPAMCPNGQFQAGGSICVYRAVPQLTFPNSVSSTVTSKLVLNVQSGLFFCNSDVDAATGPSAGRVLEGKIVSTDCSATKGRDDNQRDSLIDLESVARNGVYRNSTGNVFSTVLDRDGGNLGEHHPRWRSLQNLGEHHPSRYNFRGTPRRLEENRRSDHLEQEAEEDELTPRRLASGAMTSTQHWPANQDWGGNQGWHSNQDRDAQDSVDKPLNATQAHAQGSNGDRLRLAEVDEEHGVEHRRLSEVLSTMDRVLALYPTRDAAAAVPPLAFITTEAFTRELQGTLTAVVQMDTAAFGHLPLVASTVTRRELSRREISSELMASTQSRSLEAVSVMNSSEGKFRQDFVASTVPCTEVTSPGGIAELAAHSSESSDAPGATIVAHVANIHHANTQSAGAIVGGNIPHASTQSTGGNRATGAMIGESHRSLQTEAGSAANFLNLIKVDSDKYATQVEPVVEQTIENPLNFTVYSARIIDGETTSGGPSSGLSQYVPGDSVTQPPDTSSNATLNLSLSNATSGLSFNEEGSGPPKVEEKSENRRSAFIMLILAGVSFFGYVGYQKFRQWRVNLKTMEKNRAVEGAKDPSQGGRITRGYAKDRLEAKKEHDRKMRESRAEKQAQNLLQIAPTDMSVHNFLSSNAMGKMTSVSRDLDDGKMSNDLLDEEGNEAFDNEGNSTPRPRGGTMGMGKTLPATMKRVQKKKKNPKMLELVGLARGAIQKSLGLGDDKKNAKGGKVDTKEDFYGINTDVSRRASELGAPDPFARAGGKISDEGLTGGDRFGSDPFSSLRGFGDDFELGTRRSVRSTMSGGGSVGSKKKGKKPKAGALKKKTFQKQGSGNDWNGSGFTDFERADKGSKGDKNFESIKNKGKSTANSGFDRTDSGIVQAKYSGGLSRKKSDLQGTGKDGGKSGSVREGKTSDLKSMAVSRENSGMDNSKNKDDRRDSNRGDDKKDRKDAKSRIDGGRDKDDREKEEKRDRDKDKVSKDRKPPSEEGFISWPSEDENLADKKTKKSKRKRRGKSE